ncbi:retron Ec78 anti-phage system effector HNH endonuclease PtuB [Shewanella sp. A14]
MKKIIKSDEPEILRIYRENNPKDDWKSGFYKNSGSDGVKTVRESLIHEQGGLCVYCEIDLKLGEGKANNDFRVEHFYPDNPANHLSKKTDGINYSLHWENLFGCCHGGDVNFIVEKGTRYTKPDVHCDINKKNHDWTDKLLNPLTDIPKSPALFYFDENGSISAKEHKDIGPLALKAKDTITLLSLDSKSLNSFRSAVIEKLNHQLNLYDEKIPIDERLYDLACTFLSKNEMGNYNAPFFSIIRWYLADGAERFLNESGY